MNMINRNDVRTLLKGSRFVEAELLRLKLESFCGINTSDMLETKRYCLFCASIIDIWKTLLCEEDRFLIQSHLIDLLDWKKIRVQYIKEWNHESVRCERTLKRKQAQSIQLIINYSNIVLPADMQKKIKCCAMKMPTDL